ncbi:MAG: hypothetical protein KDD58_12060 [Bdellovibrionales bacterium]|nr:hypothetical protein [Bdellovibrionales bacterium]
MNKLCKILSLLIMTLVVTPSYADIGFTNVSEKDLEKIVEDFSANFAHTTITGANTEGSIFGFQVGLIGGLTNTPNLETLVNQFDPGSDLTYLPHGGLFGVVSVPMGFTVEALMIPSLDAAGASFSNTGLALKWTLTEAIPLPLDIALRGHYTTTTLEYSQLIGSPAVNTDVEYKNTITGFMALAGLNLRILKPYAGIGTITGDGEVNVKGTDTIFNFTSATKAAKKITSSHIVVGTELSLMLIKFGLEYASLFGTDRYSFKVAVGF